MLIVNGRDDDDDDVDDDNNDVTDFDDETKCMDYVEDEDVVDTVCEECKLCTRESMMSAWLNGLSVIFVIIGFISVVWVPRKTTFVKNIL